jgi:hypothetical protein
MRHDGGTEARAMLCPPPPSATNCNWTAANGLGTSGVINEALAAYRQRRK